MSTRLPKASSDMVVPFQISTCCDGSLMYLSCMKQCVTDVRAWSAQHSSCPKKHSGDKCVCVVDLWVHDQPFGFWRKHYNIKNKRKKQLISSQYLFFLASSQVNYAGLILDGRITRLQVCSLSWSAAAVAGQKKDFGNPAVTHMLMSLASHRRTWQKAPYWTFKLYIFV